MLTQSTQFQIELERLVQAEIEMLKEHLSTNLFEQVGQFRYVMGQIASLRSLSEMFDHAKELASQRNR